MIRTLRPTQALALAGLVAATMSLSACQPATLRVSSASSGTVAGDDGTAAQSQATEADSGSDSSTSSDGSTSSDSPVSGGSGAGGPGSLTLSITSPRTLSGHVDTAVTCATGRRYRASASGDVKGYAVRVNATAIGYTGPGSYPTTLSGTITAPDGESFALAAVRTTGQLDAGGGSTSFSVTGSRGHTLAGSVAWACS